VIFSVPSGNFGDLMGGLLAWRLGLPVERFVVATNANDEVPKFLATGRYGKIVPSLKCISNAMNVGHPSNLARIVDLYGGWMDEQGVLKEQPDMTAMRRDLYAVSIDDERQCAVISTRSASTTSGLAGRSSRPIAITAPFWSRTALWDGRG